MMKDTVTGATPGPVDMSVTMRLYITELPLAISRLQGIDQTSCLSGRLADAYNGAIGNGDVLVTFTFSPTEQGILMGCLGDATCRFSGGLRFRLQQAMVKKLVANGAPENIDA